MDVLEMERLKAALDGRFSKIQEVAKNFLSFSFQGEEFDAVVNEDGSLVDLLTRKGGHVGGIFAGAISSYSDLVNLLAYYLQGYLDKRAHRHEQIELTKTAGAVANTILEMILAEVRPLYPEARFGHRSQGVEEAAVAILAYGIEVRLNDGWLNLRWADDWLRLLLPKYEDPAFQPKAVIGAVVSALKRIEEQKRMEGMVFKELAKLGTVDPQGTTNDVQKILEVVKEEEEK